jgi:hypothetical protein
MSTLKVTNLQKLDGTTFPVGKIGQVVSVTTSTQQAITATSFTDMTGMSLSITPSSATSKILYLVHLNGGFLNTSSNEGIIARVRCQPSGGTDTSVAFFSRYAGRMTLSGGYGLETLSIAKLFTVSSAVEHTFKVQFKSKNGNSVIMNTNDEGNAELGDSSTNSTITLMEVLA